MDNINDFIPFDAESTLVFFVNGKKVVETQPDPEWTLLWYLRRKLQLTGTKYGCGEGGCGACTVMVSQYLSHEDTIKHMAVNACLMPVCAMHGMAVTTVEGIGSTHTRLHPVQERIAKAHGSQCGFCTPGIVMSMYCLLRNKKNLVYSDIDTALQGNLCRCTGYRPIIEGFKTFMEGWEINYANKEKNGPCMMGEDCCKNKKPHQDESLFTATAFKPYDPTQESIFPPELKINYTYYEKFTFFKGANVVWIRPKTLKNLLQLKNKFPISKIVVGNTEIGVEVKFKKMVYPILLQPSLITEMYTCDTLGDRIIIGAAVTLTELQSFLEKEIKVNKEKGIKVFEAIIDMLHLFAGKQVRNVASLAGNIITSSPISDLNPILMASSSILNVCNEKRGYRKVVIDDTFFKSYRKTAVEDDEVVISIEIPFTENMQYFNAYKQAKRKDDDISIVTAAFNVKLDKESKVVTEAKLCYGGMGPMTVCASKTSNLLIGHNWDRSMLDTAVKSLTEELQIDYSAPGGMAEYRMSLCLSLFFKFFIHIFQSDGACNGYKISERETSGKSGICFSETYSSQYFEIKNHSRKITDMVGKPIIHASAMKQATGEAIYCDDIPQVMGELYLTLVFSTESHAKIISIDATDALAIPGVEAFLSAKDLENDCNKIGPIFKDEEIFARDIVTSRSCVIGALIATSESIARKAKNLIRITYERLEPVIVTIEDAIFYESFYDKQPRPLKKGNVQEIFAKASHKKNGYVRSGAQEHFYLETISAFAIRKEEELEIVATTQSPGELAQAVSDVLGIPNNKVVAKVKRIGGGFGGKETRSTFLALPVAIAAYRLKKPVRAVLDRDEDMQATGYRHPCLIEYMVAFENDCKISGVIYNIYCNAGNSMDISCSMLERLLLHVDNCYFIPNIEVYGYLCKTNTPSNTAFRGFGAPKAMLAAETMMRDIASVLNKSYEEVVSVNMYREGQLTHFNQQLTYCTISSCWEECINMSNYWKRKQDVKDFNASNRWKKKGIALVPTKYGISFQVDVFMQAGALVLIYKDGSVLLSIGGIEMGQGLFTKMIQIVTRVLEVDISKIHLSEMSTDKVPNSSPTAASISSDLYGMAVMNACNILKERLEPYKVSNTDGKWEDWVSAAYVDRVPLSATGFYAAPKIEYDRENRSGNVYEYFTYGVACSEVIIDCLTGDHQVIRTDIVMDVGESLNPAIDIGQIEGAFMQGYGFHTMEEMVFSPSGEVLSRGPGTYKIPGFSDIPKTFNVSLLKGAPNPRAVYSSKAVGEPPLFMAASVFFAIKEAIKSARCDARVAPEFVLHVPATCERIRMACEDQFTQQVKPAVKKDGKPWNVVA